RAGVRTPAQPRAPVRSRRQKGSVTHGQDVSRRQAEARVQVQDAQLHALQQVRPPARGVPEVRPLPDLPARARAQRLHPRHDEVQLVGEKKMLTDPIADMLTRIRNANKAMHDSASMPTSGMKVEIARLLKQEGYIKDYRIVEAEPV